MCHPNRPALIKGATDHWPAKDLWTDGYLCKKMHDSMITVAVTPNGYADAVTYDPIAKKDYFILPHEEQMSFKDFLNHLHDKNDKNAYYISLQNGSLPMEYGPLINDVDSEINWCSQALGKSPDAVNFWFGDEKSITSLHKDPYENLYAVVRGQKTFILYPPIEYMCLHESIYPSAIYKPSKNKGEFDIVPLGNDTKVPWVPVNPLDPSSKEKYPRFKYAQPITVVVEEGDMLYLPALWFHQVLQEGDRGVIAVNYWYDMEYQHSLYHNMGLYRRLVSEIIDQQPSLENI
ncbi:unnamed protein product [Cunninghamella echinulata]